MLILMGISILFSLAIYNVTTGEINDRLDELSSRIEYRDAILPLYDQRSTNPYIEFLEAQQDEANHNIFMTLYYVNIIILLGGGALSYWLARRTLASIEVVHEAQSRFTSDASHELRTPLAAMKMELEVALRDNKLSKEEMREILQSNLEEVDKLSRLSHMLLQLSKAEYSELEMEALDVPAIATEVISRYDKAGTRINLEASTKTPKAHGNKASIEELCAILIDNALKYSPTESMINMRISKRSGKVCLEITNSGKGIAAADLPRIFDRFYRADTSRTNGSESGYGLGLSLAKKIVEVHHGGLSASSSSDQTMFTVLLPVHRTIAPKRK